jgi:mannose-6-phosphate isomerase
MTTKDIEAELGATAARMKDWLFESALPLWWRQGADRLGGFHESLDGSGKPANTPRRARVQARQCYVYALAGELGWSGPWREAAEHGWLRLDSHYRDGEGLYRGLVSSDGRVVTAEAKTYDQAFVLLALAQLHKMQLTHLAPERNARNLLDRLMHHRHHAHSGFRELGEDVYLANPNMHMFEACLAWADVSDAAPWRDLAKELSELAVDRLIDTADFTLPERFDSDWTPTAPRLVEPGHQFEWAWLLEQDRAGADKTIAAKLYASGCRGVDGARDVAVDTMDGSLVSTPARLWPQTERARVALRMARRNDAHRARYLEDANGAARAITRYLDMPLSGIWRDRMLADATFVEEPAPASSFYHLVGWIKESLSARDAFARSDVT